MKKILKTTMLLILIMLMMIKNIAVIASVIDIGESSLIKRGDLGFYTLQYWNEAKQKWMYVTYSKTYYIDKQGKQRIAYCTDPDLDGVGWLPGEVSEYEVDITKQITYLKLWRVYKNGYPFVTPQELGVETEDDAYLATKQAAYSVIRGKSASQVCQYYRAGQDEINGQNLEETTRRGEKVVSAIKKLVKIADDSNEQMPKQDINKTVNFKQDEKKGYFSQEYKIKDTGGKAIYTIKSIENAPEGTYIADMNGNEISTIQEGKSFKIMVEKEKIKQNCNININYSVDIQDYPVYYAKAKNTGMQNYVVVAEKNEIVDGYFSATVIAGKSNVKILKIDEETRKPISGVKFNIKYKNGDNIGDFITNESGVIELKNIKQGELILNEISTLDNYELKDESIEISVEYGNSYNIEITNKHKKGSLELLKVDGEEYSKVLSGTEFDLLNSEGEVCKHIITDEEGKAFVDDLDIGEYTLIETKTSDGYRIGEERKIEILWKEKISVVIENEKQKGNIKIIKTDKDNTELRIPNVKFEILDSNMNKVADAITNENGEVEIFDLPVGKYYIKEVKTNEKYIINSEIIEVNVEDKETIEKIIENEKIKGQIKVIKVSADYNKITQTEAGKPIEDVTFGIYNQNKELIQEIKTDKNGEAISEKLEKGIYYIKEIEGNKWYILDENYYKVEITKNGEISNVEIKNKSKDPEIDIKKYGPDIAKINQEIKYEFDIKNNGNVELSNFTWYDFLPYEKAKVTKISTGTYNQDIYYSIFYKTNKKQSFMILEKDLSSKENHYIDLSRIYLENEEKITQIKVEFGNVAIGFSQNEKPCIYMQVNEGLEDGENMINETILEANYNEYKICDEDKKTTIIQHEKKQIKKLPRTGF